MKLSFPTHASFRSPLAALAVCAGASLANAQTTLYVDDNHPGDPGPGNPFISNPFENGSASDPFDRIQEGIDAAASGDTVLVSPGMYFEFDTLDLSDSVAGVKTLTIRSTDGPASTTIDATALVSTAVRASKGETAATIFEGFLVQGGAPGSSPGNHGGNLAILNSSPTIRNCWFISGVAYIGGGAYVHNSASRFEDCTFMLNDAAHQGGGVYTNSSPATFERCTFDSNSANHGGGFLARTTGGTLRVLDSLFVQNEAQAGYAGGLAKFDTGSLEVARTRFVSNVAVSEGGGMHVHGGGIVRDCIFNGNEVSALVGGGANAAAGGGAGAAGTLTVFGSTFTENVGGAVAENGSGQLVMHNSIAWGNTPYEVDNFVTVQYSDVTGGFAGVGNIDANPRFKDAPGADGVRGNLDDDLSLRKTSPCIDAGNTAQLGTAPYPTDILGEWRAVEDPKVANTGIPSLNLTVDMGAYEHQPPRSPRATSGQWNP